MRRKTLGGVSPIVLAVCFPTLHNGTVHIFRLEDEVAWVKPEYSRNQINKAGKALLKSSDSDELRGAREIIANWRSAHAYPLNGMTMTLGNRARKYAGNRHLLSQRLKRLVSIENKLLRRPEVRATQIQDLGGCRVVLQTMADVARMHRVYLQGRSRVFHLHRTDDYIYDSPGPKRSGYRSLHLVYRYNSPKCPEWRNMRIELQIRSRAQHAWATAVEAVSFFEGQDLKASEGNPDWLRLFVLASHYIAKEEGCPGILDEGNYIDELRALWNDLNADIRLLGWRQSLRMMMGERHAGSSQFVLHLDVADRRIEVTSFGGGQKTAEASAAELAGELELEFAEDPNHHIVNVSVRSVRQLERAYPGFFADTKVFRDAVMRVIDK